MRHKTYIYFLCCALGVFVNTTLFTVAGFTHVNKDAGRRVNMSFFNFSVRQVLHSINCGTLCRFIVSQGCKVLLKQLKVD